MGNQVAADDPRLPAVYDNYRRNLIDICNVARHAGAAGVLSTVAVNLKDCPPFASRHRSDLSAEDLANWKALYQAGIELENQEKRKEAIGKYEAAAKIDDRFAELAVPTGPMLAARPMGGGPPAVRLGPRLGHIAVPRRFPNQRDRSARWPPSQGSESVWSMRNNRWPRAIWRSAASWARDCSMSTSISLSRGIICWRGCWRRSRRSCPAWPPRKQEPVPLKGRGRNGWALILGTNIRWRI